MAPKSGERKGQSRKKEGDGRERRKEGEGRKMRRRRRREWRPDTSYKGMGTGTGTYFLYLGFPPLMKLISLYINYSSVAHLIKPKHLWEETLHISIIINRHHYCKQTLYSIPGEKYCDCLRVSSL